MKPWSRVESASSVPVVLLPLVLLIIVASTLVLSACGTSGDGDSTTQSSAVSTTEAAAGHWEGEGVSLDWPAGWRSVSSAENIRWPLGRFIDCTLLFALDQTDSYPRVELIRIESPSGGSLQEAFDEGYTTLAAEWGDSMREVSDWTSTVDGSPALVKSYELPSGEPYYEHQDVWFDHEGTLYVLTARDGVWTFDEHVLPDLEAIARSLELGTTE